MKYLSADSVPFSLIYQAFSSGFSDYIIPMKLSLNDFSVFLEKRHNQLENSFVALNGEEPVGVILGGFAMFENAPTLHCGGFCVNPEHRGTGISQALFEHHKKRAQELMCTQLMLEVISTNQKAISFYKKENYHTRSKITYYSKAVPFSYELSTSAIAKVSFSQLLPLIDQSNPIPRDWLNEPSLLQNQDNLICYSYVDNQSIVGGLVLSADGDIYFISSLMGGQSNPIRSSLLSYAAKENDFQKLSISVLGDNELEEFLLTHEFSKGGLEQYQMFAGL